MCKFKSEQKYILHILNKKIYHILPNLFFWCIIIVVIILVTIMQLILNNHISYNNVINTFYNK